MNNSAPDFMQFSEEAREARTAGKPLVALESTILAHGLPRPRNLELGLKMEALIREEGAVPATVAVLDGKACIGLSRSQLERLCEAPVAKAGVRDLAVQLSSGGSAATTVSATLRLASLAAISVVATGGIGGVHPESWKTGDVSSDLIELARSRMALVCAGGKSILDLPMTLEALETQGISVVGFQTTEFPAFYSRSSGLDLEHTAQTVRELAEIVRTQRALGGPAVLVVQPVPQKHEIAWEEIRGMLERANHEAAAKGVSGKAVSPYLLARLFEISGGRTLEANHALALNNCRLAARLSRELGG